MATTLESRADLRAAFFTRMNASDDDDSLGEFYADPDEAANRYIQQGLDSAQAWTIEVCDPLRWLSAFGAPLEWQTDDPMGLYVPLPDNFLRLSGDAYHSAIIQPNGLPWGQEIEDPRERHWHNRLRGYYLANNRLYLAHKSSKPPRCSIVEYHFRLPILADDADTIDFPLQDRWIIVAFAAWHAIKDDWPAGGQEMESKIERDLEHWQREIAKRQRRTRKPRRIRSFKPVGANLLLGRRHG